MRWGRIRRPHPGDITGLLSDVSDGWSDHNIPRLSAAVAFYTLLSLAPLLVIVVAVAGAIFGREAAEGQLVWQIQDLIGRSGAETVQTLLRSTQQPGAGVLASLVGTLALIMGATTAVSELRDALNTIWCPPKRVQTSRLASIRSMAWARVFAFASVLGIGGFLILSLAANAVLAGISAHYQSVLTSYAATLLRWVDIVVAYVVFAGIFALIYKLLPNIRLTWGDVIPGALLTSLLFGAGRFLIGLYLGRASYASVYGAAGSMVVFLVWVYYSAQIFFLGVEFTRAWAQRFGSEPCRETARQVTGVGE